jgi:hypothetical protein
VLARGGDIGVGVGVGVGLDSEVEVEGATGCGLVEQREAAEGLDAVLTFTASVCGHGGAARRREEWQGTDASDIYVLKGAPEESFHQKKKRERIRRMDIISPLASFTSQKNRENRDRRQREDLPPLARTTDSNPPFGKAS